MTPGLYSFTIWRGTTQPFTFRLKTRAGSPPVDTPMTWTDVTLTIAPKGGTTFRKKLTDALPGFSVTDAPEAEITWTPTTAESRLIPVGDKTDYEVEVKDPNGVVGQVVYLYGKITGKGGLNDD